MSSGWNKGWRLERWRRARRRAGVGARHLGLAALGALAAMLVLALGGGRLADARALPRHDPQPTLTIVNPKSFSGPVGTRVTITISGSQKGQQYTLGYADANGGGCSSTVTPISSAQSVTIGDGGTARSTFAWPPDSGTGTFSVCASGATGTAAQPLQSSAPFQVLSTSAPSIDIQPAATPTPTGVPAGSPVPNTLPAGSYYAGSQIIVNGHSFLPGGTTVALYIASTQTGQGVQLTTDPNPINANTTGDFTATATLPQGRTGTLYVQAISTDGSNGVPPSLFASAQIQIVLQPTPTPQPTATATTSPSPTATPGSGGNNAGLGGDTGRTIGAAGLGGLSVVLLITGAWLLVSAGGRRQG
jgi:hypothetical protein